MDTAETTFAVDSVAPASKAMKALPARVAVESILGPKDLRAEACCPSDGSLLPCQFHGFVSTVHLAYAAHYPLVLSPDHIWLMIAQGFAQHIHLDPERWRDVLGLPAGQRTLEIRLDDLTRDTPPERWAAVWDGFVELLRREQPGLIQLLTDRFSTSAATNRWPMQSPQCRRLTHTFCTGPEYLWDPHHLIGGDASGLGQSPSACRGLRVV